MRLIADAPVFQRPIYLAYPANPVSSDVLDVALSGLRALAAEWSGDQALALTGRPLAMSGRPLIG